VIRVVDGVTFARSSARVALRALQRLSHFCFFFLTTGCHAMGKWADYGISATAMRSSAVGMNGPK
jgi:hypothetical protein